MSSVRSGLLAIAVLVLGSAVLPGCGGSDEPVVLDAPETVPSVDLEQAAKDEEKEMKNYDPRKGTPAGTGSGSSPANL